MAATSLNIRIARPDELQQVSSVLLEADAWLRSRGEPLWSLDDLHPTALHDDVEDRRYVLAFSLDMVVGAARVADTDSVCWPDADPGLAWYVHRLAVRRAHAGGIVSRAILDWAAAHAASSGQRYLRLDCDISRRRLCELYERFGFRFHSEQAVGAHRVARYQRALTVAA